VQIVDRFGTSYTVKRWPNGDGTMLYYVLSLDGDAVVARAVLQPFRGCVTDVLVYHQANRRRGVATALYPLIEADLGRPLVPSRIRSLAGRRSGWRGNGLGQLLRVSSLQRSKSARTAIPPALIALGRRGQHLRNES